MNGGKSINPELEKLWENYRIMVEYLLNTTYYNDLRKSCKEGIRLHKILDRYGNVYKDQLERTIDDKGIFELDVILKNLREEYFNLRKKVPEIEWSWIEEEYFNNFYEMWEKRCVSYKIKKTFVDYNDITKHFGKVPAYKHYSDKISKIENRIKRKLKEKKIPKEGDNEVYDNTEGYLPVLRPIFYLSFNSNQDVSDEHINILSNPTVIKSYVMTQFKQFLKTFHDRMEIPMAITDDEINVLIASSSSFDNLIRNFINEWKENTLIKITGFLTNVDKNELNLNLESSLKNQFVFMYALHKLREEPKVFIKKGGNFYFEESKLSAEPFVHDLASKHSLEPLSKIVVNKRVNESLLDEALRIYKKEFSRHLRKSNKRVNTQKSKIKPRSSIVFHKPGTSDIVFTSNINEQIIEEARSLTNSIEQRLLPVYYDKFQKVQRHDSETDKFKIMASRKACLDFYDHDKDLPMIHDIDERLKVKYESTMERSTNNTLADMRPRARAMGTCFLMFDIFPKLLLVNEYKSIFTFIDGKSKINIENHRFGTPLLNGELEQFKRFRLLKDHLNIYDSLNPRNSNIKNKKVRTIYVSLLSGCESSFMCGVYKKIPHKKVQASRVKEPSIVGYEHELFDDNENVVPIFLQFSGDPSYKNVTFKLNDLKHDNNPVVFNRFNSWFYETFGKSISLSPLDFNTKNPEILFKTIVNIAVIHLSLKMANSKFKYQLAFHCKSGKDRTSVFDAIVKATYEQLLKFGEINYEKIKKRVSFWLLFGLIIANRSTGSFGIKLKSIPLAKYILTPVEMEWFTGIAYDV